MPGGFTQYNGKILGIKAILTGDLAGQQAIEYYEINKRLDQYFRTKVIHVIVDYFLRSKVWVEKKHFKEVTTQILDYFKTDNPDENVS